MQAVTGKKFLVIRCPFCGKRQPDHEWYSPTRLYPPGKSNFGMRTKCQKCGIVTTY